MTRLLRIDAVADIYGVSVKTIRRKLITRDGSVAAPAFEKPWRWRESDIDRHINTHSVVEQRRTRNRRLQAVS